MIAKRAALLGILLVVLTGCSSVIQGAGSPELLRTKASSAPPTPTATSSAPATPSNSRPLVAASTHAPAPTAPSDPLSGDSFYVDPNSSAANQVAQWNAQNRGADAAEIGKIARWPQAVWFAGGTSDGQRARTLAQKAAAVHQTPLVVAYNLPNRDCTGGYSAGGAQDPAAYQQWISDLATGLGMSSPVVILEPDAIPNALNGCLSDSDKATRFQLLAGAVSTLDARTHAKIYIDAGNAGWVSDPAAIASALRSAGIGNAAGFALNVSNFYTTPTSISYGLAISQQLGGVHFVIDTSRNGNGPSTDSSSGPTWCNPPGRSLGQPPTVSTGQPFVDAYLWIKNPGESDGACRFGAPPAGQWWPDYALAMAEIS